MKKRWIIVIIGAIAAVLLLRGFLFSSYIVPSKGMENALLQGDRIIVNKWSYGLRVPLMTLCGYHRWGEKTVKTGDIALFNNPVEAKQPTIDCRSAFIGRCIAIPGDIIGFDTLLNPVSLIEKAGPDRKRLYSYPPEKEQVVDSLLHTLSIFSNELMGQDEQHHVRSFSPYEIYLIEQRMPNINWLQPFLGDNNSVKVVKELTVPGKGKSVKINAWNATIYCNTLVLHEQQNAAVQNDTLYIDGKPVTEYTFAKDYYWMASNNSVGFADSRLFGFVPHDHLIGKATLVWFSKEAYTGLLQGYRWERFFRSAN